VGSAIFNIVGEKQFHNGSMSKNLSSFRDPVWVYADSIYVAPFGEPKGGQNKKDICKERIQGLSVQFHRSVS
jgi:hypothetical protein